ncbi:hypothetical protein F4604DRAFT_1937637 [Suillus subluteus]|nr:hypothetical protein F4604DRAFT_1937637 [Suillus subluteus]
MILVKNIPYGTTAEQIREMFELHVELSRVIVPPTSTMAVVEFEQADEAAKAFQAVAYRRLGSSAVYLEKDPMGMFQETADAAGNSNRTLITAFKPITIAEPAVVVVLDLVYMVIAGFGVDTFHGKCQLRTLTYAPG